MYKRTIYILLALLLVTEGCGPSTTQSATPSAEPITTEPLVIVPTDTPIPTPTPRQEGWVVMETANYPNPRTEHAMAMLPDGSVLLFGGRDVDGNVLGDTWIIRPDASVYTPLAGGRQLAQTLRTPDAFPSLNDLRIAPAAPSRNYILIMRRSLASPAAAVEPYIGQVQTTPVWL